MKDEQSLVTDTWLKQLHSEIMEVFRYVQPFCDGNVLSSAKITIYMKQHSDRPSIDLELSKIKKEEMNYNHKIEEYEAFE